MIKDRIGFEGPGAEEISAKLAGKEKETQTAATERQESAAAPIAKSRIQRLLGKTGTFKEKRDKLRASLTDDIKPSVDFGFLIGKPDIVFLTVVIKTLFLREIQPGEFVYLQMLRRGAKRGAVIYKLCSSDEFDGKCCVENFLDYEKEYFEFASREKRRRLPFIRFFTAASRMRELEDVVEKSLTEIDAVAYFGGREFRESIDSLSFQTRELKRKTDGL